MIAETAVREERIARQRIFFGPLADALERSTLDAPILVIGSPRSVALLDGVVPDTGIVRFAGSRSHNPLSVVEEARRIADDTQPKTIIGIGSASAVDLGKAVADGRNCVLVSIPTTLGGAEMTSGYGVLRDGEKHGGRLQSPSDVVIYDAQMLSEIPPAVLGSTGINAWAHSIEAHYARRARPLGVAAAERAGRALPALLLRAAQGHDAQLDAALLEAAFLAGFALEANGMGLHHAVCHVCGGLTQIPHGIVNAIVLPHAVRANQRAAGSAVETVERAFGVESLVETAEAIARAYRLPRSFAKLGVAPSVVERAVPLVLEHRLLQNNPAPLDRAAIEEVVRAAYEGESKGATR